jgi:hypothetical protein
MQIRNIIALVLASAIAAVGLTACDDDSSGSSDSSTSGLPQPGEDVTLDPADFSTTIDNPYWPMAVGSKWVSEETDAEGAVRHVVVTVTDKTKVLANGVEARVVHDAVTEDGQPEEITDDYYAQDSAGNIWYLGEDTAEYTNGKVTSTHGSFEAGVDGAQGGVVVPAHPEAGQFFRQEFYAGEAEDEATILSLDEQVQVAAGHFTDVMLTSERNPLEPRVAELKFYAPNVGPVFAIGVSGSTDREELLSYSPGQ